MKIIDCEQGSPEWFEARRGLPTASEFATIMARGRDGGVSKTRKTYMHKLAGEIVTGQPMENYTNAHMERGKDMEDEARDYYAFTNAAKLTRVGFITNDAGTVGGSPDSLIGNDGVLEIKTALPHILIDKLIGGGFPPEHKAQCQGNVWIAERDYVDITIYWPGMTPFEVRAGRDESYIRKIADEVDRFNEELAAVVEKVRAYGRAPEPLLMAG